MTLTPSVTESARRALAASLDLEQHEIWKDGILWGWDDGIPERWITAEDPDGDVVDPETGARFTVVHLPLGPVGSI